MNISVTPISVDHGAGVGVGFLLIHQFASKVEGSHAGVQLCFSGAGRRWQEQLIRLHQERYDAERALG